MDPAIVTVTVIPLPPSPPPARAAAPPPAAAPLGLASADRRRWCDLLSCRKPRAGRRRRCAVPVPPRGDRGAAAEGARPPPQDRRGAAGPPRAVERACLDDLQRSLRADGEARPRRGSGSLSEPFRTRNPARLVPRAQPPHSLRSRKRSQLRARERQVQLQDLPRDAQLRSHARHGPGDRRSRRPEHPRSNAHRPRLRHEQRRGGDRARPRPRQGPRRRLPPADLRDRPRRVRALRSADPGVHRMGAGNHGRGRRDERCCRGGAAGERPCQRHLRARPPPLPRATGLERRRPRHPPLRPRRPRSARAAHGQDRALCSRRGGVAPHLGVDGILCVLDEDDEQPGFAQLDLRPEGEPGEALGRQERSDQETFSRHGR